MFIFSLILSPIFHLYSLLMFVVFHVPLIVGHRLFGEKGRRFVIKQFNYFMHLGLYILGSKIKVHGKENIPKEACPLVVVSNHQSLFDISIIGILFASNYIDFVSKSSLGKNIPVISYNLRHGHSALVDREKGGQSVREIIKFGRYIQANNTAACIFPEGTRSQSGELQELMPAGVATLLRAAPSALVVPFVIKGHSDLISRSRFFMKVGQRIEYTILPAINPKDCTVDELMGSLKQQIGGVLEG